MYCDCGLRKCLCVAKPADAPAHGRALCMGWIASTEGAHRKKWHGRKSRRPERGEVQFNFAQQLQQPPNRSRIRLSLVGTSQMCILTDVASARDEPRASTSRARFIDRLS